MRAERWRDRLILMQTQGALQDIDDEQAGVLLDMADKADEVDGIPPLAAVFLAALALGVLLGISVTLMATA